MIIEMVNSNWVDKHLRIEKDLSFEEGIELLKEESYITSTEAINTTQNTTSLTNQ